MRNRPREHASAVERLRLAIDCMPVATRDAMLNGLRSNERIIVGAYVDELGGVCPMLAAHRCGGRTDFLSFARSWDRFARSGGRSRAATERELRILTTQLEASLEGSNGTELDRAIAEHRQLVGRSMRARRTRSALSRLTEAADPSGEITAGRLRGRKASRSAGDDPARGTGVGGMWPVPAGV